MPRRSARIAHGGGAASRAVSHRDRASDRGQESPCPSRRRSADASRGDHADIVVAVVENGLRSQVAPGEQLPHADACRCRPNPGGDRRGDGGACWRADRSDAVAGVAAGSGEDCRVRAGARQPARPRRRGDGAAGREPVNEYPYWWDTAPGLATDAAREPLPSCVDVAIVGGGYTGLSAARQCAKAGASVVVLDREHPGGVPAREMAGRSTPG